MSIRIERRLRRKFNNEETPSKFCKSSSDDRDSEVLNSSSSSQKSDIVLEKRARRKKIRSTQDFNHLSRSTLVGSEESIKPKAKKTKKTKTLYSLPKINQVAEDFSAKPEESDTNCDELISKKKGRKKSRKPQENEIEIETNVTCNQYVRKRQSKENSQSANSASDSNRDSEVEIVPKSKRLKNKKRNKMNYTDVDATEVQIEIDECYAKRIKQLLSDEPIRKTRSGSTSNSFISTPISERKSKRSSLLNKKRNTKSVVFEQKTPPKAEDEASTKQSISVRLSRQSTPHPKLKVRLTSCDETLKEEEPIIRKSRSRLSDLPPAVIKIKQKNSTLSEYVSFDMDFESDDVFAEATETPIGDVINTNSNHEEPVNNMSTNNVSMKIRKSVRFKSPEQNSRRETLIISKPITSYETPIKVSLASSKNVSPITDMRVSTSGSTKRNSTFEITSPKVVDSRNSFLDISRNPNDSHNSSHKYSGANLSRQSMNSSIKRKSSSVELFSPQRKSFRKSTSVSDVSERNSVNCNEFDVSHVKEANIMNQNITSVHPEKRCTFSKDYQADSKLDVLNFSVNTPKLIRTATFTKDDETIKEPLDVPSDLKYSSPLYTASKLMDTSKVNKRRRWDKSRLNVSILDNSVDIGNISAPWIGNDLDKSLNLSLNTSEQKSDIKSTPAMNAGNKSSVKNQGTPPSASSTPFPKGKNNLLREALLKQKQSATVNESKISEKQPVRKIVRKVPNFALIHQRALDKIENIKEMSERKAIRAKLLLSGHKPLNDSFRKTSSNRKELKFSPTRLKSTPLKEVINRSLNKSNISVSKIGKVSPSTSNPKVVNKENRIAPIEKRKELLKMKSHIPIKSKVPNTVIAEKKGFTRFGFKQKTEGGAKVATKDEQVKAVAQKTKILKNTLEERRTIIQGVRSNRRFELLMQRRHK